MAKQITELNAAGAVDSANDLLWLEQGGLPTKISPDDLGIGGGGGLADGTVANAMLRWSGSAWVENTTVRLSATHALTGLSVSSEVVRKSVPAQISTAGSGWYRVAKATGSVGRGSFDLHIYATGGSFTPNQLRIKGHKDWATLGRFESIWSTANTWWTGVRIVDDTAAGDTYIEVNFTGAVSTLLIWGQDSGQADRFVPLTGALTATVALNNVVRLTQTLASDTFHVTNLDVAKTLNVGDATLGTVAAFVGGIVGANIATFQRDPGGASDTLIAMGGGAGLPYIHVSRDSGLAPWSFGMGTASDFVIAQDTDTSDVANYRLQISSAGIWSHILSGGAAKDYLRFRDSTDAADLVIHYDGSAYEVRSENSGAGAQWLRFSSATLLTLAETGMLVQLPSGTDVSLTSTNHPFQIGGSGGANIRMDSNEINAVSNGVASTLNLNTDGGTVSIGANTAANLIVGGTAKFGGNTIGLLEGVTGGFGSVQCNGAQVGGFEGYNIAGRGVFMWHPTTERGGIYDDVNNRWVIQWNALNAASNEKLDLHAGSVIAMTTQVPAATSFTSAATIQDSVTVHRDIGFNVLPTFNFNASDTLDSRHCGHSTGKTNTTTTYKLTGPTSSNLNFPVGGVCTVMNLGASGNYTLEDTSTCTMRYCDGTAAPVDIVLNGTLAPGGVITLYRYSTAAIYIFGSGFTP